MGSNYPQGFYDDETMAALTQAFREVWKTIVTLDPFRDVERDERLRQIIAQTMMDLSDDGISDVDALRDRTLAKIVRPLAKRPNISQRRRLAG